MDGIDVVIVHYHAARAAARAVEALRQDSARVDLAVNIIIDDNGSTAEEREILRAQQVTYVSTGRNAGYAGALKIAFPLTRCDFIIVMNEDVIVLPGCLAALHSALIGGTAIVGPEFYWDL